MLLLLLATTLLRVVDGDSMVVQEGQREFGIRIQGIDCPESQRNRRCKAAGAEACEAQLPKGRAATRRAQVLLPEGSVIVLGPPGRTLKSDRYGRTVATVQLPDGRDYGSIMLSEGLCAPYSYDPDARPNRKRK